MTAQLNTRTLTFYPALLLLSVLLSGCSESTASPDDEDDQPERKPRVLVIETNTEDITLSRSYAARTQGSKEVEVRARIEGELTSRDYQEGQLVKKDDLLFTIEAAPYKAALEGAQAELQRAQAEKDDAQRQWDRIRSLFEDGAVSQRERDQGQAQSELAEANMAAAEAAVTAAEIDYSYTEVRSPITGVAGQESYSVGNVVNSGDNLTTVVQLDPLYVYFSVPESDTAASYLLQQVSVTGGSELEEVAPAAEIELPNGQPYGEIGYIDFVGRQVDSETGTLNARASIPNPQAVVLPGQFTRVRIPDILLEDAVAIPERAVVQSGEQSVVYVVTNGMTELREVVLGPRTDDRIVIESGLSGDEQVVVEGLAMLRPGTEVNAEPFEDEVAMGESSKAATEEDNAEEETSNDD